MCPEVLAIMRDGYLHQQRADVASYCGGDLGLACFHAVWADHLAGVALWVT